MQDLEGGQINHDSRGCRIHIARRWGHQQELSPISIAPNDDDKGTIETSLRYSSPLRGFFD